jgi:hypothetical protein
MQTFEDLPYQFDDGIAMITLNRPDKTQRIHHPDDAGDDRGPGRRGCG